MEENNRKELLDAVESDYNNPNSKYYRDNERYSYMVRTINNRLDELESNDSNQLAL